MKKAKPQDSKNSYFNKGISFEENHYQKHLDRVVKGKCRPMNKGGKGK